MTQALRTCQKLAGGGTCGWSDGNIMTLPLQRDCRLCTTVSHPYPPPPPTGVHRLKD